MSRVPPRVLAPGSSARALLGVVVATVSAILPAFLLGAVAVQAGASLGFDEAGLGLAVAVYFLAAAVSSAALGRLAETMGPDRALRCGAATSAVVSAAIGLAPGYGWVLLAMLVGGFSNALVQPAANVLVARLIRPARHGTAFGIKQSAMPASTMLGGLAVPALALTVGWRWSFAAASALALLAVVLVPDAPAAPADSAARMGRPDGDARLPALLLLAVGVGLGAAGAGALAAFLVTGAVAVGLAPSTAGWLLTVGSVVGVGSRLLAGALADRRSGGHLRVVAAMLGGGALAASSLAVGRPWVYALATLVAFGAGWGWPGLFNFSVVRHNPTAPGAATGITQTGTYVGAVIGPLAFGAVAAGASFSWAWLLVAGCYLASAVAMLAARRLLRRDRDLGGRPSSVR